MPKGNPIVLIWGVSCLPPPSGDGRPEVGLIVVLLPLRDPTPHGDGAPLPPHTHTVFISFFLLFVFSFMSVSLHV